MGGGATLHFVLSYLTCIELVHQTQLLVVNEEVSTEISHGFIKVSQGVSKSREKEKVSCQFWFGARLQLGVNNVHI